MKTLKMSLAASLAVAASLSFTGCEFTDTVSNGSSTTTATAANTKEVPPFQGSTVNEISLKGLTLKFDDDNSTCFNNKVLTTATDRFSVATADFNASATEACTKDVTAVEFSTILNRSAAKIKDSNETLEDKYGPGQFMGHTEAAFVNIDTTVQFEENNGSKPTNLIALDLNSEALKGMKEQMAQKTLANKGKTPDTAKVQDRNALKDVKTADDLNDVNSSALPTDISKDTIKVTNQALSDAGTDNLADVNATVMQNAASTLAAAGSLDNNDTSAILTDFNSTKTAAEAAAEAQTLIVNSIDLTIGSNSWSGTSNNFSIVKTASQEVSANDDVTIALNASFKNNFSVSNGTLKAVITDNDNTNNKITMMVSGVSIDGNATSSSATIASGSHLALYSDYENIGTYMGTIQSDITTEDLTFSLDTLSAAVSNDSSTVDTVKSQIITALSTANTYTVTVGLSGVDANATTNLEDQSTPLEGNFEGYTGTVTVQAAE